MADKLQYQRVVGSLLHLKQCKWPDIALPVAALAAYTSSPGTQHHAALLDVVRNAGGTASLDIPYGEKRVVTMYGGALSWSTKKQATMAASTMDAESQACEAAAWEGMSLRKAFEEMSLLLIGWEI
jgi:hypothetical protein